MARRGKIQHDAPRHGPVSLEQSKTQNNTETALRNIAQQVIVQRGALNR
ncbi:hypothetical protein [Aristophania vespae]|nr:hypothetical protein [Aristophania vespae]